MITLTIGVDRRVTASGRLISNETAEVRITGMPEGANASAVRIYLLNPAGVVCAYSNDFGADYTASLTLATATMRDTLRGVVAGRFVSLAVLIENSAGEVYGSGFVPVVAMPIQSPIDIGATTVAEIRALLAALAAAEEPDTQAEQWRKVAETAGEIAGKLIGD